MRFLIYALSLVTFYVTINKYVINSRLVNTKLFAFRSMFLFFFFFFLFSISMLCSAFTPIHMRVCRTTEINRHRFFVFWLSSVCIVNRRVIWNAANEKTHSFGFLMYLCVCHSGVCAISICVSCAMCECDAYKLAHSILYFRVTIDCNKACRKCGKYVFFFYFILFCSSTSLFVVGIAIVVPHSRSA